MDMKIYKTLGSKQTLLDKGQAVLMAVFFFIGAIYENLFFLLFAPTIVFAVTFIIKEKIFLRQTGVGHLCAPHVESRQNLLFPPGER
jgi:hypothetical protein